MSEPRAVLVKVAVQPTFVVITDEGAREFTGSVAEVAGADWTRFAADAFGAQDLAAVVEQFKRQTPDES